MANEQQTGSNETVEPKQDVTPETEPKQRAERGRLSNHRRFPILLRVLVVVVLAIVMLAVGAIIGYSMIGGGEWKDVFNVDTWRHITDFWLTS